MKILSQRQEAILNRVVDTHIETGEPVGSQSITALYQKRYQTSYSSATVRCEMGELEEKGYLTHPHISAGRIPTDRGYRFYVDHGMRQETLSRDVAKTIVETLEDHSSEMETILDKTAALVSQMAQEVGLVAIKAKNDTARPHYRLWINGFEHLLAKPEFQDWHYIRDLAKALDNRHVLAGWLMNRSPDNPPCEVEIGIGSENQEEVFKPCSVISRRFVVDQERTGVLALVGPKRMRYSQAVLLVRSVASRLEAALEKDE